MLIRVSIDMQQRSPLVTRTLISNAMRPSTIGKAPRYIKCGKGSVNEAYTAIPQPICKAA
jgi:hypothetical protein